MEKARSGGLLGKVSSTEKAGFMTVVIKQSNSIRQSLKTRGENYYNLSILTQLLLPF